MYTITLNVENPTQMLKKSFVQSWCLTRTTDNSKYFLWSHRLRVNEFQLYYIYLYAPITLDECHAWFHLYGLCQAVRNGKRAKNSNENILLSQINWSVVMTFVPKTGPCPSPMRLGRAVFDVDSAHFSFPLPQQFCRTWGIGSYDVFWLALWTAARPCS